MKEDKYVLKVKYAETKFQTSVTFSVAEIDNKSNINEHAATTCWDVRDKGNTLKRHIQDPVKHLNYFKI